MTRWLPTLLLSASALGLAACGGDPLGPITALPRELSAAELNAIEGSNTFGIELLRQVARAETAPNVFLSPLSASMALGMAMNGTAERTWDQMRAALGFLAMEEREINGAYRDLIALLLDLDPRVTFGLGNSIWAREGIAFEPDFYDRVTTYFDAEVRKLDFADPGAPAEINDWVEDVTRGRIREMVGEIPAGMIMYLINAVYFKGDWTSAFDRGRTADADFHLASGGTVQVPMMHVNAGFRTFYSEQAAVHGVELPYGGGAFTALAIAPWDDRPIADVLTDLTPGEWDAWMAALDAAEPADAMVALPRFGLEYERMMNEDLQALGMTDAFDPVLADFSRLVQGGGVHISEVKQKTFLKVDEEGTEAAAATSVGVRVVSAPPYFRFDRPFLFAIRERFSGTILFIGVIGDPGV